MSEPGTTLADHLRLHLAVLESAGVRLVPKAGPPPELPVFAEPEPEVTPADRVTIELEQLASEVSQCAKCPALFSTRSTTVFGGGPVGAEVCFIGDFPRRDDEEAGHLFAGELGDFFDRVLTAMGFARADVYLCTVLKCRTPGNRQPKADECDHCREHLTRQLALVRPRAICCLGVAASRTLLDSPATIQKLRGTVHDYHGRPVVCTYHPDYVRTNLSVKPAFWDDLKLMLKAIGRPLPGK